MFLVKNSEALPCISIKDLTCAAISGLFSTQNGRSMVGGLAYLYIYIYLFIYFLFIYMFLYMIFLGVFIHIYVY